MALQVLRHSRQELLLRPADRCSVGTVARSKPSARTNCSISAARSGRRWSALAPVEVGVLSTTYSRLISPASGLRRLAKSRT